MKRSGIRFWAARLGFALVCCLVLSACDNMNRAAEDRDPNIRRARALRAVGDFSGAIESYEKALAKRPKSARIHWEMASIYDMELTNDLRAIYHYERFLEMNPKAERKEYAQQLIAAAKMNYAISLPDRFSYAVEENARLKKEIETLRALVTEARDELARASGGTAPAAATAGAGTSAAATRRPAAPEPAKPVSTTFDSYVVQSGDTLGKIASRFYGDATRWDVIAEANKASLNNSTTIKVGQTLIIPR